MVHTRGVTKRSLLQAVAAFGLVLCMTYYIAYKPNDAQSFRMIRSDDRYGEGCGGLLIFSGC